MVVQQKIYQQSSRAHWWHVTQKSEKHKIYHLMLLYIYNQCYQQQ